MVRLGRRASLLVVVYVLTSAATAHAECAWVLWGRVVGDPPPPMSSKGWFIRASFQRRADCVNAYTVYLTDGRRLGWVVIGDQNTATGQGAFITSKTSSYQENLVCRPDSVPPTQGGVLGS